jgi:predicted NAD-dependent protein-ADP-ribosyltransferase YbiA (DUF1768 family)
MAEDITNQGSIDAPEGAPIINESQNIAPQENIVDPNKPNADLFSGIFNQNTNEDNSYVRLNYDNIKDNLFTDQTFESIASSQLEPGYVENIERASNFINTNLTPTYTSSIQYAKEKNNNPAEHMMNTSMVDVASMPTTGADYLKPSNIVQFGYKSSNFDRYYNHNNFQELGFHPYRDNDAFYNENSSWWDDNARAWGQFGKVFGTGFMSTYDAIGDAFSSDGYLQAETGGADNFAEAMRIGNTTRGGASGFATNLMLNSGYTVGILSSIAVEELALAALEVVTLGGATPVVASRTAYNALRLARTTDKVADSKRASEALVAGFKNADNVKSFWNSAGKFTGSIIAPNTMEAMKVWKTTQNTAQSLSSMAKIAKTSGGLYRDFRMMNLAMAESKLEAGMVKNDLFSELYSAHVREFGNAPSDVQLSEMHNKSNEGAFTTTMWNFPVIFFSNHIVFGTALKGFKGTAALLNATKRGVAQQIGKKTTSQVSKGATKGFYDLGESRTRRFINRGFGQNLAAFGGSLLRYTAPNSIEGFQEIIQEAVAVGAKDYYTKLYNDPLAGGLDAQYASIGKGAKSQWSGQGFEVFMSGFLMGGLVQGPQKWVMEGGPKLYQKVTDPEGYAEYKKQTQEYINETIKVLNEVYEDPSAVWDPTRINALNQKILNENLFVHSIDGNKKAFLDTQDASLFKQIHTVMRSGKAYEFRSQLEDFLKLDDTMLAEAFPEATSKEHKTGKIRSRIGNMLSNLNEQEQSYKDLNDILQNPFDQSNMQHGSPEWIEEGIKYETVNHAKMLALYTRKTFQRALERSNSIRQELANNPIIAKMSSRDIDALTSMQDLITEIDLLKSTIRVSAASEQESSADQQLLDSKNKKKLSLLQDYFAALTDPSNIESRTDEKIEVEKAVVEQDETKKQLIEKVRRDILSSDSPSRLEEMIPMGAEHPFGIFNSEKIDELEKSASSYLEFIADNENDFIDHDAFKETLVKIVDFKALKGRAEDYNKAIQYIMSPNKLNELADSFVVKFREFYIENKKNVRSRMEKYVDQTEKSNFLNTIAQDNVYPPAHETELWLKGEGKMPTTFLLEDRVLSPIADKAIYGRLEHAVGVYNNSARKKDIELDSKNDDFVDVQNDEHSYDDNFLPEQDQETGEVVEEDVNFELTVTLGKEHLAKEYRAYQNKSTGIIKTYTEWLEDPVSQYSRKIAIAINKIRQEVYGPKLLQGEKDNFEDWLLKNKETEEVQNITKLFDVTVNEILGTESTQVTDLGARESVDESHPSGVTVMETSIVREGKTVQLFKHVDDNNNLIDDDAYGTEAEAKSARDKKVRNIKKDSKYDFAGQSLKKGMVIQNKTTGKKFMIKSQKKDVAKNNNLWVVPADNVNGKRLPYITPKQFIKNYDIVTKEIIEDKVKTAKLLTREPLGIAPVYDTSIKNKKARNAEKNESLQKKLVKLTQTERDNLSIRIRKGPNWLDRTEDTKKLASFEFDGVKNPRIKIQKQKLYVEIMNGKETIGFFQGTSTSVLLAADGKTIINPLEITKQEANDLFRRFKKKNGKGYETSIDNLVSQIKHNYTQAIAIEESLELLFKNSGKDELVINISKLKDIGVSLSEGEFDFVEGVEKGASGVTFGELDYMFVNQTLDNENVTVDGKRPYFVMDYSRDYPTFRTVNGKKVYSRVKGTPLTNIDLGTPEGNKLNREVNDTFIKYESKSSDLKGKYIALVSFPNGASALVKLKPDTMQPEDVDALLNTMKERSLDTFENHQDEGTTYNTQWNKEFNESLFIAAGEGIYIELEVNSIGGMNVNLTNFTLPMDHVNRRQSQPISYEALQALNNAEDLIKTLTSEDFPLFKPTMNSFKNSISRDGIDLNILSIATTQLNAGVKKGFFLNMNVEGAGASALLNPIIRRSKQAQDKIDNEKLFQEDIEDAVVITEEEKIDIETNIILSDYQNIEVAKLKEIALKRFNKKDLTEVEKLIYNARREDINAIQLEIATESVPDVSTKAERDYQENLKEVNDAEIKYKEYIKNLRKSSKASLVASDPELYNVDTSDGIVEINRELRKIVAQDEGVLQMKEAIKVLNEDANKIFKITKDFDGNDIEDINTFRDWLKENLPEDIINVRNSVELDWMATRMKNEFVTVGSFNLSMTMISNGIEGLKGIINTTALQPFKYHEAFHGVFRMLLTDVEIQKYLGIAKSELRALYRTKKGYEMHNGIFVKSEAQALDLLRSIHPGYAEMGVKELSNVLYEEYIADRFDEFKMNPANTKTNTEIKSLFTRIIEWIKAVLGQFKADKSYQLNSLFKDIDGGKYKRAGVTSNRFTEAALEGIPLIAYKKSIRLGYTNLPYKNAQGQIERKKISNVMPGDQQNDIISGASNLYIKKLSEAKGDFNKFKALEESIIMTIEMYNPDRKFYNLKSEQWQLENNENLENIYHHLNLQIDLVTELVNDRLDDTSRKVDLEIEEIEADGVRTTEQYGKSSDEIGGIDSMLDPVLKDYIATTTINEKDIFENEFFDDNKTEPFVIGVDVHDAFNGILKATANEYNEIKILQKAWLYSRSNPNSKAFIDRLFKDLGIFDDAIGVNGNAPTLLNDDYALSSIKDSVLYQMFVNGFENARTDYMFIQYDSSGIAHMYSATKKDDAHHTLSQWANKFNRKYRDVKVVGSEAHRAATDALQGLQQALNFKDISSPKFKDRMRNTSNALNSALGMDVNALYLEYSVLKGVLDQSNFTEEQILLLDTFNFTEPITMRDQEAIVHSINLGENIFLDQQTTKTNIVVEGGVKNRLRTISLNNAPFSESVGATVFKDPEGNLIYAHQMPTYHLIALSQMKGQDWVTNKLLESPYMKDNILLNDPKFQQMVLQNKVKSLRITGTKDSGQLRVNDIGVIGENAGLSINQKPGTKYGESSPKQFVLALIHAYLYHYNSAAPGKSETVSYVDENNETQTFAMAPSLIRVIEASNTGDLVSGPVNAQVIKTEEGLDLTEDAVAKRRTLVKQSFERAQREANPETQTTDLIYLGNTDKFNNRTDQGRLTKLDDVAELTNSLQQKSNRAVNIKLPNIGEQIQKNIFNGDVKTVLREAASAADSNLSRGQNSIIDIRGSQFVMVNNGSKKFTDLTNEDQASLINNMGTSLLTTEEYNKRSGDKKMWSIKLGTETYYSYVFTDIAFFKGRKNKTLFSFTPLSEQSKVAVGFNTQKIRVKNVQELKERAEKANEEGNNQLARILLDKIKEIESLQPTSNVEAKKADIEKRRQEEIAGRKEDYEEAGLTKKEFEETIIPEVNSRYDAELAAIETTQQTSGTINIYAGTGENAELSNFAERPHTDVLGIEFRNVESAFQYAKTNWAKDGMNDDIRMQLQTTTGAQAKALGRKIKGLDVQRWDKNSADIMKTIIEESFEGNPEALAALLATGNATLTHTQDKSKWGKLFPKVLMEVRSELDRAQPVQEDIVFDVNTAETMDVDTSVIDGLMSEIQKARDGDIVSFEDVWEELNGDDAIRTRAIQDVNEHIIMLKENGAYDEISTFLKEGLGLVQNKSRSQSLEKVSNRDSELMMEYYNLKEDSPDFNLAQIFLNDHLNTTGYNQILLGDQAYSLKDSVDAIKRAKMQNAAGKNASSIIHDDELGVYHNSDIIKQLLFQDELVQREFETIIEADRSKEASKGERTDGQMYITLKALRYFLFGFGELTVAKADILDKIAAGEKVAIDNAFFGTATAPSFKKQGLVLNSMKLAYGDGKTYLKMSAAVLTPELTSVKRNGVWVAREGRKEMHNLRTKLENYENEQWENGIGVLGIAVPASASKMMKVNMQTTDTAFGNNSLTDDMVSDLHAKNMRLQVINPSNKVETVDPRQIKNLITSEQSDNVMVNIGGIELSIGDVKAMYHRYSSTRATNEYFKRRNLIFSFSGSQNEMIKVQNSGAKMSLNLTAFLKYAIRGLESAKTKSQMMDYFSMDEFGEPKYDLNNQLTVSKFQELFLSFFNKGVLAERQPGISAALMSDAGFKVVKKVQAVDKNGTPTKWVVIRSNDWEGMKNLDDSLSAVEYTDTKAETFSGLKVNDYYLDHLRSNVMGYNKDGTESGVRHTEMMIPPHFKSIIDNAIAIGEPIPEAIAKMFGIRIPSQDKHSAVNLMVVDWLPVYMGSTAIFSRDLVEISGADFDIDKLYMQIKDFYVKSGEFIEYGSATNNKEAYEDYIRYTLKEYGKKETSLHMAVEEFLRREKSIDNAERIGLNKNTASMNALEKEEFMKKYLSDKEFKIKVELFDILSQDNNLSVKAAERLFNRAEGLAEALKMLGLPVTSEEYNEYREKYKVQIGDQTILKEPYKGANDNKILDSKFALLGNAGMTDPRKGRITGIASEPAVLTPLTDENAVGLMGEGVWQYIQRELPELAAQVSEEGIDVNNFNGKMISWDNNKEGARSIGAVVRPNLLVNILQEFGIKLRTKKLKGKETFARLDLNGGVVYDNFGVDYTINPTTGKPDSSLHRKQFVISALVTAMTDNAKERLAKKLGLTKDSLSVVTTMLSLGVDVKTTILLIKHPTIANAFAQAKVGDSSAKGLLSIRRSRIQDYLKESKGKGFNINVKSLTNMNKLFNSINEGVPKLDRSMPADLVGIPGEMTAGWTNEELQYDLKVIEQFLTASDISNAMKHMSELVDLQKGWGQDLTIMQKKQNAAEELGLLMTNKEFEESKIPVDVRNVFKKDGSIHYANYQMFREGYDILAPQVFLQRTEPFEKIFNSLLANLSSNVRFTKGMEAKLSKDVVTYLNTKAYLNKISKNSFQTWQLASLQNGMIYENVGKITGVSPEALNVGSVVDTINKYLTGTDRTNYFMENYISLISIDSESNTTGQTLVEANTWTSINDAELTRIQNSLLELYQDPLTHKEVTHLINYLLVKDGFQHGPNTFLGAVPAELTSDILNSISSVHALFKFNDENHSKFKEVFDLTYEELFNEFIEGYMSSTRMDYYLNRTKVGAEVAIYNLQEIEKPEGSILIDFELAESTTNTQVLSNLAARPLTYRGRDYGSVIHAFQTLRSGEFNEKTNKAYMKEGISNAFGKVIENKAKKKRGTNVDELLKQLIRASFMQADSEFTVNGIEVRKELILHADFTFMTNDKITKVTREGLLAVQKDMVYNVKDDGSMTIISKQGVQTQRVKNDTLRKNPMVRDSVNKTFTINAHKGANSKYTDMVKIPAPVYNISKIKKGEVSPRAIYDKNLRQILKDGGFNVQYKMFKIKGVDTPIAQIVFPYIIENSMGLGRGKKTYKLVKLYPDGAMPIDINAFKMMDDDAGVALGSRAEYVEIDQFGSTVQNAIGFALPGYIPTKVEIEAYLEEKKNIFADVGEYVEQEMDVDNVIEETQETAEDGLSFLSKTEEPVVDLEVTEEVDVDNVEISFYQTPEEKAISKEWKAAFDKGDKKKMKELEGDKGPVWDGFFSKLTKLVESGQWNQLGTDEVDVALPSGENFFGVTSIVSAAKASPAESKILSAWNSLSADERFSAANVFQVYSAEDLTARYNKTNNIAPITVNKFMENLKCGL